MIIFDLDGTLADCEHRRPLLKKGFLEKGICNWTAFLEACDKDEPIRPTVQILQKLLIDDEDIQIWTGRSEKVREKTIVWLEKKVDGTRDWGQRLKMRPDGDSTPDDILKESWLDDTYEFTKWGSRHPIQYVFDDRPKVIRMWRRRGIFVFNCLQHDKEF